MKNKKYIMALDQGTTSSRCILFTASGEVKSVVQREFTQHFPSEGWVEHDPLEIWSTQISVATEAILKIGATWDDVACIGIANQRETTVVWDKETGEPIYNAIVWQCRRTADFCDDLKKLGYAKTVKDKTGLLLDPYFSASKLLWILDNVEGAREKANEGRLLFGTIDTWLIWKLTGGRTHATDYTNASRTMLYNIHTLEWDKELLDLFSVPKNMLPAVKPSSGLFGYTDKNIFGAQIPISGVAGDQQAALFGQGCYSLGDIKNTYGTGGFLLMNTGDCAYESRKGLLTTIAWGIGDKVTYALEGSVFSSGSAIQWLRDGLSIIKTAKESEDVARQVESSDGVFVVPAFSGLGAPYWDPYSRGIIIGITRSTNRAHIVRATLDSMAYQTYDVVKLMMDETGVTPSLIKVDGGASMNNLLLEIQADILGIPLERPECTETTALGAAYLAGLGAGIYCSFEDIKSRIKTEMRVLPTKDTEWINKNVDLWHKAVTRSLGWK